MENINTAISWAEAYCADFSKNNEFDPFAALMGTENRQQKIFSLCVDFLENTKKLNNDFSADLKKILYRG